MKKQIMKLSTPYNGNWKIIMDDSTIFNKFSVYRIADGHTKLIQRYSCVADCLQYILEQTTRRKYICTGNEIKTD